MYDNVLKDNHFRKHLEHLPSGSDSVNGQQICSPFTDRSLFCARCVSGSTTILRNNMKDQNSGLNLVKMHQSVRKRINRLGKLWLVFFWDAHGVIFIDYLEKGRTITGANYATLLDRLVNEIRKKRPHLRKKKILHIAHAKKHELGFELLPHPPYFPDLSPGPQRLVSVSKPQEMPVW